MKAGVIGYPIHHSKSPLIHQYWLHHYGIQGSYKTIEVKPEKLKEKIQILVDEGFCGFNVTIPHKENIFKLCDEVDEAAKKIGAVNTVIIKDKKLFGKNTDAFGFIQNIKSKNSFEFKGGKAFVIGAGGASRAILYGLLNEGVEEISLTNRTKEKAENLKNIFSDKIKIIEWEEKENYLSSIDLLVNTTSLGMVGQNIFKINLNDLNEAALVTDIVYNPLMTPFLRDAKARGNEIVTGIGMLLHQACPSFQAWTGIMPEVTEELQQKVLR